MKMKLIVIASLLVCINASFAQDPDKSSKTEAQIESEVVRYLAVQLTDGNMTKELIEFLGIDDSQVSEILAIIEPVTQHHAQLELQRIESMCGQWNSNTSVVASEARLDASLSAYDSKLNAQRSDSVSLYKNAISDIGFVVGPQNEDAWDEFVTIQRTRMARAISTHFSDNVLVSVNPVASINSLCGGQ